MSERIVRIGGASGFWGDSAVAAPQLVHRAEVDYLVFDYLAELTMSILARARANSPDGGYATDFVSVAMKSVLKDVAARGIRVVANAGGVNPRACAQALAELAEGMGVSLKIAVVEGDDLSDRVEALRAAGVREMSTGAPLPERVMSVNAYLGALPIAAALREGAQVVITGRCVDSAVVLGPLIHEFGWTMDDYDRLAAGSLAGHILECGAQGSGGLHTDWEAVERWEDIGYPIAECASDGSFVITKPAGTGGLVTPAVVAEQMLYEIGDPGAYVLPDVVCDFTGVEMTQVGEHRVRVTGVRGRAPTDTYKVCATWFDGWRAIAQLTIIGIDAARKAERTAAAILARTRAMFERLKMADYKAVDVEILGAEAVYGPHSRARAAREVVMKLAVQHDDEKALGVFAREVAPAGTSWSPGTTGVTAGRPKPQPVVRLYSFLFPKSEIRPRVVIGTGEDARVIEVDVPPGAPGSPAASAGDDARAGALAAPAQAAPAQAAPGVAAASPGADAVAVPLVALAWGRSGDKGDSANVGIIARRPEFLPLLRAQLTPEAVADYFRHLVRGEVRRYELPGIGGMNFVMQEALGGGGMASLRNDPLGKGLAQMLLDAPIRVPADWVERFALRAAG